MSLKLLLVDDHPILRAGLRHVFSSRPDLTIVGEASTGADALWLAAELLPDVAIMDIHLPDMNGVEVVRQFLAQRPAVKVIIFSAETQRSAIDGALKAGACGYLWKKGAFTEIFEAIDSVALGKLYFSPEVKAAILKNYKRNLGKKHESAEASKGVPTEREKELLRLIADGWGNKEIAEDLHLRPQSVRNYRARLRKKFRCGNTAELVRYAVREQLVGP